jgi:hypothetical protein
MQGLADGVRRLLRVMVSLASAGGTGGGERKRGASCTALRGKLGATVKHKKRAITKSHDTIRGRLPEVSNHEEQENAEVHLLQ